MRLPALSWRRRGKRRYSRYSFPLNRTRRSRRDRRLLTIRKDRSRGTSRSCRCRSRRHRRRPQTGDKPFRGWRICQRDRRRSGHRRSPPRHIRRSRPPGRSNRRTDTRQQDRSESCRYRFRRHRRRHSQYGTPWRPAPCRRPDRSCSSRCRSRRRRMRQLRVDILSRSTRIGTWTSNSRRWRCCHHRTARRPRRCRCRRPSRVHRWVQRSRGSGRRREQAQPARNVSRRASLIIRSRAATSHPTRPSLRKPTVSHIDGSTSRKIGGIRTLSAIAR
jgi:hypothetical protein